MVNFISEESRGYARFIEGSIAGAQEVLQDPAVIRELGYAAALLYNLTRDIYVPNVIDDKVVIPAAYLDGDALPVIALRP
jgi:hypothetical protein